MLDCNRRDSFMEGKMRPAKKRIVMNTIKPSDKAGGTNLKTLKRGSIMLRAVVAILLCQNVAVAVAVAGVVVVAVFEEFKGRFKEKLVYFF